VVTHQQFINGTKQRAFYYNLVNSQYGTPIHNHHCNIDAERYPDEHSNYTSYAHTQTHTQTYIVNLFELYKTRTFKTNDKFEIVKADLAITIILHWMASD
jgi:hypothetical protein